MTYTNSGLPSDLTKIVNMTETPDVIREKVKENLPKHKVRVTGEEYLDMGERRAKTIQAGAAGHLHTQAHLQRG